MSIPKILHFVETREIADSIERCIKRAKDLNPSWSIRVWTDPYNQMRGDLRRYLNKANCGAQIADLFRLEAVYAEGGVYLDTDMFLHKSLDCLTSFDRPIFCANGYGGVANCFFASPPGHPAVGAIVSFLLQNEPDWRHPPNETTGPMLFTTVLRRRTDIFLLPRVTFLPYRHDDPPERRRPHRLSFAEHLGEHSWKDSDHAAPSVGRRWIQPLQRGIRRLRRRTVSRIGRKLRKWLREMVAEGVHESRASGGVLHPVVPEVVVRDRWGNWVWLDGRELWIHEFAFGGVRDPREQALLDRVLGPGDWMVDVGASYGFYTAVGARRVGPFGRVWAFEPNPRVRSFLSKTVRGNWFDDRVVVRGEAVMDRRGSATLHVPTALSGLGSIGSDETLEHRSMETGGDQTPDRYPVDTVSLGEVLPPWIPVRVLKIDVEGNEDRVLAGCREGLRCGQFDWIVVEVEPWRDPDRWQAVRLFLEELVRYGYVPGTLSRRGTFTPVSCLSDALRQRWSLNMVFRFGDREPHDNI